MAKVAIYRDEFTNEVIDSINFTGAISLDGVLTNAYTDAAKTKVDYISVTTSIDLDDIADKLSLITVTLPVNLDDLQSAITVDPAEVAANTAHRNTVVGNPHQLNALDVGVDTYLANNWLGSGSITTLGTIDTGTWQGNIIQVAYGGTGANNADDAIVNITPDLPSSDPVLYVLSALGSTGAVFWDNYWPSPWDIQVLAETLSPKSPDYNNFKIALNRDTKDTIKLTEVTEGSGTPGITWYRLSTGSPDLAYSFYYSSTDNRLYIEDSSYTVAAIGGWDIAFTCANSLTLAVGDPMVSQNGLYIYDTGRMTTTRSDYDTIIGSDEDIPNIKWINENVITSLFGDPDPTLSANLDVNSYSIFNGDYRVLSFYPGAIGTIGQENYIEIYNVDGTFGNGPMVYANGFDTNIPITLKAKGTGNVILGLEIGGSIVIQDGSPNTYGSFELSYDGSFNDIIYKDPFNNYVWRTANGDGKLYTTNGLATDEIFDVNGSGWSFRDVGDGAYALTIGDAPPNTDNNYLHIQPSTAAVSIGVSSGSTDTDVDLEIYQKGAGLIRMLYSGNYIADFTGAVSSPTHRFIFAAGDDLTTTYISVDGVDSEINLAINSKVDLGTSYVSINGLQINNSGQIMAPGIADNKILTVSSEVAVWADAPSSINISGTPVDNQLAVWTASDTLEGDSNLAWDGMYLHISGNIGATASFVTAAYITYIGETGFPSSGIYTSGLYTDAIYDISAAGIQMMSTTYFSSYPFVSSTPLTGNAGGGLLGYVAVWNDGNDVYGDSNLTWDGGALYVFGNTVLTSADVGTSVQAYNTVLTDIAGSSVWGGTNDVLVGDGVGGVSSKSIGMDIQAYSSSLDGIATLIDGGGIGGNEVIGGDGGGGFALKVIGTDIQEFYTELNSLGQYIDGGGPPSATQVIGGNGASGYAYLTIGTEIQGQGDVLDDLNNLGASTADGEFLVATGAGTLAWESGATARTSIGLGTTDDPTFAGITVTNIFRAFNDTGTNKIGFFGATPSAKAAALSTAATDTVDTTYGTEESTVINNLRTRLNELESRLQAYGLLT